MWSFLWSPSQVFMHLVGFCSVLVLVCREWRWISGTKIHVLNHVLTFSSLISILVSFWIIRCLFPLCGLPWVLLVLLSYHLSIQPFSNAFSVAIFSSKIVRFLWRMVVGMCLCHTLPIVDKILFCLYCFTLCRYLFSLTSFPRTFWFISSSCTVIFFLVLSLLFSSHIFQDISVLPCCPVFVDFLRGFPVDLPILVLTVSSFSLRGPQFSHTVISPVYRLDHLTQIYYLLICEVAFDLFCLFLF